MPGRYSHGVVLADYSSRGIINLPPDQVSKYLQATPLSEKPSMSQLRLRGTRSAQATYLDVSSKSPGRPMKSDLPKLVDDKPAVPPKDGQSLSTEYDPNGFNPMRYSRYYEQTAKSTPNVGLTGQSSHPEMRTAYRRQRDADGNVDSMPSNARLGHGAKQLQTESRGNIHASVARERESSVQSRKDLVTLGRSPSDQGLSNTGRHEKQRNVSSPPLYRKRDQTESQVKRPRNSERSASSGPGYSSQKQWHTGSATTTDRSNQDRTKLAMPDHVPSNHAESRLNATHHAPTFRSTASPSRDEGIVLSEPDFEGFSDIGGSPSGGYFDWRGGHAGYSRSSSRNSIPTQRPTSSGRPSGQDQRSQDTETPLGRPSVIHNDVLSSPSQTTQSSVKTSTRAHRSNSSASSVSVSNGYLNHSIPKHSLEGSRKNNQTARLDQPWRLPEISEDNGFSPSIFEDKDGQQNGLGMTLESFDADLTIGQISSGKDVTFDNSDAMSELSAALPPPITRFRDEEDEFNANMAKFFGDGADYTTNRKASHSIGRSATKKTMGFFSKLRTKGYPLNK